MSNVDLYKLMNVWMVTVFRDVQLEAESKAEDAKQEQIQTQHSQNSSQSLLQEHVGSLEPELEMEVQQYKQLTWFPRMQQQFLLKW